MLKCLNNDSKMQMRLNIKRHRQKLLQYLENTNDTVLKPKIKLVSNNIEKSNLNNNVKPKIASSTEPKFVPTIKVTSYRNKSTIRIKTYESVINTKPTNLEVLTDNDIKEDITTSSTTVNQLQPNFKVNIQKEPISNVVLRLKPLPKIAIKDPEPPPPVFVKKLKEQLIEELLNSSSSEEIDDSISVGNNEDWNEIYQSPNGIDVDDNDSRNLSLIEAIRYDGHKEEEYMYDSADNDSPVLDINYPTTKKRSQTRKSMKLTKPQFQIDQPKQRFRKSQDRSLHNAKERACRERIAQRFTTLRNACSYLNTNRRVPSKHSILLAAKKECDLLQHLEKKLLEEKNVWLKANETLKNRISKFHCIL